MDGIACSLWFLVGTNRSPKFRGWRFNEPPFVHYLLAGFEHLHSTVALAANLLMIVHCYGVRGTTDNNDGTLVVHLYLFLDGAPAIPQIYTDRLAILSTTMHTSTQQFPTTGARHPTDKHPPRSRPRIKEQQREARDDDKQREARLSLSCLHYHHHLGHACHVKHRR